MRWPAVLCWILSCSLSATAAAAVEVTLSAEGGQPLPVVISPSATPRTREAAETLAEYLEKISGTKFSLVTEAGARGIRVGRLSDFPGLKPPQPETWDEQDPTRREDYWLRSREDGLELIGVSDLAVEHAVWDLLYRLGYRQFFPGPHWEFIPRQSTLKLAVDVQEHPDYLARRIWYGFGPWDYAEEPYRQWCARNRCTSGITLNTGHAYDGIISRNKAVFRDHPEYLGLVGGERKSTKFCISNPALRELVLQDALAQLKQHPEQDSVSVDPSDGLGWCECADCRKLGSVTDRALLLANEVAEAIQEQFPGRYVGMYAYSGHSPPPQIRVHPRVIISVATAFVRGGYSVDELLEGWHRQGATLGIREYFSVHTWDRDLPGRSRGSDREYVTTRIPHFHRQGARFFSSESSDNWGPNGLGYYLASRLLWDVSESGQVEHLVEDFLEKCFGPAREPMRAYYELIDGSSEPLLSDHLIGQMYSLLNDAQQLTDDPAIQRRLDDLILYTRYVELFFDYSQAEENTRQGRFERLIRHGYRMRQTMLIHSKALYRDLAVRDKQVAIPPEAAWNVPEPGNPWKNSEPFRRDELDEFVRQGLRTRPLRGFEPATFSDNLVPATALKLQDVSPGKQDLYSRGERTYFTWVSDPAKPIVLTVSGGRIYQDRGAATLTLRFVSQDRRDQGELPPLATAAAPPDGKIHTVRLQPQRVGLHTITVSDGGAGTVVEWPAGQPMTVLSSLDQRASFHGRWSLYFYVPRGTEFVGGYSSGPGKLLDGSGKAIHTFDSRPGYFRVPVEAGQDARLWKFEQCAGERLLMTVPPCLARNAGELLLPQEVMQADAVPGGR